MFENIIAEILNRLLGSYVSPTSFQADRVSTSVYKGYVLFSRLELRSDALDRLLLPITLKKGLIVKTEISIPWTQLGSRPVEISLDGVYLLISSKADWTVEELDRRAQAAKFSKLAQAELIKRSREAVLGLGKLVDGSASDTTFASRLISRVTDNIEIRLKNIHIRFEEPDSFCFGITLDSLSIQTTDNDWIPRFKENSESETFKLCKLERFSIYGDFPSKLPISLQLFSGSDDYFINFFSSSIPQAKQKQLIHRYILKPLDGELRITVSRESPLTKFYFSCSAVDMRVENFQLVNLSKINTLFVSSSSVSSVIKYGINRPKLSPMQDPRSWWNFAISCVLKDIKLKRYKWSRSYFSKRRRDRLEYTLLWKRYLVGGLNDETNRRYVPLSAQDKARMEWLEKCLEFSDIMLFRSYAENELRLERAHQELWELGFAKGSANASGNPASSSSAAVASSWISWALGASNSNLGLKESLSQQDVERFLAVLRHNPATSVFETKDPTIPESVTSMTWTVFISKGCILLPPLRMTFIGLELGFTSRINSSFLLNIALQSFIVYDGFQRIIAPRENLLPKRKRTRSATADELDLAASSISTSRALLPLDLARPTLTRQTSKKNKSFQIFELSIDTNRRFDIERSITLKVKPLDIIFLPSSLERIKNVLKSLRSSTILLETRTPHSLRRLATEIAVEFRELLITFSRNSYSQAISLEFGKIILEDKTLRTRTHISNASIDPIDDDRYFDEYEVHFTKLCSHLTSNGKRECLMDRFDVRGSILRNLEHNTPRNKFKMVGSTIEI